MNNIVKFDPVNSTLDGIITDDLVTLCEPKEFDIIMGKLNELMILLDKFSNRKSIPGERGDTYGFLYDEKYRLLFEDENGRIKGFDYGINKLKEQLEEIASVHADEVMTDDFPVLEDYEEPVISSYLTI